MSIPYDVTVDYWLEEQWPMSGSPFNWNTLTDITIHYTGGSIAPNGGLRRAWVRAMQRDYWNRKPSGYAIGYNIIVFPDGEIWEIRGTERMTAANGSAAANARAFAILVPVIGDGEATDEAVSAVRAVVAAIRRKRPNTIINAHQDVRATACPGAGLLAMVRDGTFEPIIESGEGIMTTRLLWKDPRYADTFLVFPVVTPLANLLAQEHLAAGAKLITERHSGVLKSLASMVGLRAVTRASDNRLVLTSTLADGDN